MLYIKKPAWIAFLALLVLNSCNKDDKTNTITLDPSEKYQEIDGFGTCLITFTTWPEAYHDPAFWDTIVNDLGVSLMRIPMPEHMERTNDNDDPDIFNWQNFYTGDNANRSGFDSGMNLLQELQSRGVNRFLATPWSPPDFTKTHKSPIEGGFLRADMYDEYAEYMAAYLIMAKKLYGIDIQNISLQNELLFIEPYRSCIFHPEAAREGVRALMHKLKKEGIQAKIVMPEDMMFTGRMMSYIKPTMEDEVTQNFKGYFGTHRHGGADELQEWVKQTQDFQKKYWMTETSGHNPDWNGAFKLANDMVDYLEVGNFSAWIYWQITDRNTSGRYALMMDGKPTPKYYAAKHFYRYIRPDARRIKSESPNNHLRVTSYLHPKNGALTSVIINNSDTTQTINIEVLDANADEWKIFISDSTNYFYEVSNDSQNGSFELPAKAIATAVAEIPGLADADYSENNHVVISEEVIENLEINPRTGGGFKHEWSINISDEIIEEAIKAGTLNQPLVNGRTLLGLAILKGDGKQVQKLIKAGASVSIPDQFGFTPLHIGASAFHGGDNYSKYDIFRMVMRAKPDISARTNDGLTALHLAAINGHRAYRQLARHDVLRINDLVEAGIHPDVADNSGRTPLHWASWQGYPYLSGIVGVSEIAVEKLIQLGATVNRKDELENTPLHYAAKMRYQNIVYELMIAGADTSVINKSGKTAVDLAKEKGYRDILNIIRSKSKPESYKFLEQETPPKDPLLGRALLQAAWEGNKEKVQNLLEQDADVFFVDSDGFRAIDRARDNGYEEIVKMLKEAENQP